MAISSLATQAQSLQLLSTTTPTDSQSPLDAVAAPSRLYVADYGASAMRIYDTSQPTALRRLGDVTGILRPRQVIANGTKVYLNSRGIGSVTESLMYAVDASNGAAPSITRTVTLPPDVVGSVAAGTLVCTATQAYNNYSNPSSSYPGRVYVFDSNLSQLSIIARDAVGLALNNNYLYLLSGNTVETYDLSTPATPVRVSSVNIGFSTNVYNAMAFANNALYIKGYPGVLTLSNPAMPTPVAITTPFTFTDVSGSTAYQLSTSTSSSSTNMVSVIDLRVPTAPTVAASIVAFTNTDPYSDTVTGQGDLVYAVRSNGGQVKTYRYTAAVLAARESTQPALSLSPNPASDAVTLHLPTAAVPGQRVTLLDVRGQRVHEQVMPAGSTTVTLSLATLRAGVYFVQSGGSTQKLLRY